jgi:ubiquinone/menaquinone biosynthesis C-methylase UbiE
MLADIILIIVIVIVAFPIFWLTLAKLIRKIYPFPAPPFMGHLLDSKFRRKMQPPAKLIERSGIKPGMQVLEIGCGSGAFTTHAARKVNGQGMVYALDIEPKMLKQLEKKLARPENQDIKNIKLIQSSAYELPFEDNSLDAVFMVGVLQEIPDRDRALQQINRVTKSGGVLAVSELFPDPDYPWKSTTIKIGTKAGFVLDKVSGNFFNYTVRFTKP